MDIRCRKTECGKNCKYTCRAKSIYISKNMICETYVHQEGKQPDTSRSMFEVAPEYAPMRDSKTLRIDCSAVCIFNEDGKCSANGITVNSLKEKPYCITYVKK